MSTLGKLVTLPLGVVARDIGDGVRNGEPDPGLRLMQGDDGYEYQVLARVIEELPVTWRRAELTPDPSSASASAAAPPAGSDSPAPR